MASDEALFERLLGGDLEAFDALHARYERPLYGFILKHVADRNEAEDVLHDAFLAVLREGKSGVAVRCFRAWVFQVARNLCKNRARSRERAGRAMAAVARAPAASPAHPERVLEEQQAAEALRRAVSRLPDRLAELYQLRAGGLSYEELARALAVPLGTVKSRMHEMVLRLQQEMSR